MPLPGKKTPVDTRRPSKALFKQFSPKGKEDFEYWHDTFIAMADPTEYGPAIKLAKSWLEWERIKYEWKEFREVILPMWHEELEVKMRSDAIRGLATSTNEGAQKWLAEGKWKVAHGASQGKGAKKKADAVNSKIMEHMKKQEEEEIRRVSGASNITKL